jgi:integrative and conjugative element protein (TIGR02256 family)
VDYAIHDIQFLTQPLEMFESQVKQFGIVETGGVLMGYVENKTMFVTKASDPGPNAIHAPDYFRADANYVDMFIDMAIANSGEKLRYLGEWHTHPQIKPYPSPKDITSLTEIADSADDYVVMLIVGAIRYNSGKFSDQHITLLKYRNETNFYKF